MKKPGILRLPAKERGNWRAEKARQAWCGAKMASN
jgi:hypothetical protein